MIKLYKEYVESKRLANLHAKVKIVEDLNRMPFLSKRFNLTEYLLTPEELKRNDELWAEENGEPTNTKTISKGLRSVGITK
jgi:hypothetical protein